MKVFLIMKEWFIQGTILLIQSYSTRNLKSKNWEIQITITSFNVTQNPRKESLVFILLIPSDLAFFLGAKMWE